MPESPSWQPTASPEALKNRAQQLAWVRGFFADRGVLEVETPVLVRCGVTDLNIDSVPAGDGWLHTSPEYPMKRLLAAGSGDIYQVARVFRHGERGKRHNPEFSLLEWYRIGFDDVALMAEVADLVCGWLGCPRPATLCYRDLFIRFVGVDPFAAPDSHLRSLCKPWMGDEPAMGLTREECLDLLMSHLVEPELAGLGPVFVTAYPASQAALARVSEENGRRQAHRFELYVEGLELCNGYWELTDPAEQRARFESDNRKRQQLGKPPMPLDEALLQAMEAGIPECAGVALGLDRLLMLKLGVTDIAGVLAFPAERA